MAEILIMASCLETPLTWSALARIIEEKNFHLMGRSAKGMAEYRAHNEVG